ncbi:hypothetical protein CHS0354_035363 [Potamilus streckersoni]|uniref:ABC transporter domain-containing protein n=1 Tax=Potamilus streckersoni TaxID=2493646 RepID=A0AAE0VPD6_9BIVA|nr:hypothetical protein CHS0354_035363 [Potamilus streckersoni]
MLSGLPDSYKTILLVALPILVITGLTFFIYKNFHSLHFKEKIGYCLIIGGAIGNLYDRAVFSTVTDFTHFLFFGKKIENLSKYYGYRPVLKNINLSVAGGIISVITGDNGSGKSTLLDIISGYSPLRIGSVKFSSKLKGETENLGLSLAYLPAAPFLYRDLSVIQNICIFSRIRVQHNYRNINQDALPYLKLFNLEAFSRFPVKKLSTGMIKKTALCCILMQKADLWILDEPYAALDKKSCDILTDIIRQHTEKGGTYRLIARKHPVLQTGKRKHIITVYGGIPNRNNIGVYAMNSRFILLIKKDIWLHLSNPAVFFNYILFSVSVYVLFRLTVNNDIPLYVIPGSFWTAYFLSGYTALTRIVQTETQHQSHKALICAGVSPTLIYIASFTSLTLFFSICLLLLLPLHSLFFNSGGLLLLPDFILIFILITFGFNAGIILIAGLLAELPFADFLLPVLCFPIQTPLILGGIKLTEGIITGSTLAEQQNWLILLFCYDIIFFTAGYILTEILND